MHPQIIIIIIDWKFLYERVFRVKPRREKRCPSSEPREHHSNPEFSLILEKSHKIITSNSFLFLFPLGSWALDAKLISNFLLGIWNTFTCIPHNQEEATKASLAHILHNFCTASFTHLTRGFLCPDSYFIVNLIGLYQLHKRTMQPTYLVNLGWIFYLLHNRNRISTCFKPKFFPA